MYFSPVSNGGTCHATRSSSSTHFISDIDNPDRRSEELAEASSNRSRPAIKVLLLIMSLLHPKAFCLEQTGAVAGSFPRKNGTLVIEELPFLFLRPHPHTWPRTPRMPRKTTTPHLLERPVQQWAFLETAEAGPILCSCHTTSSRRCAHLRIF